MYDPPQGVLRRPRLSAPRGNGVAWVPVLPLAVLRAGALSSPRSPQALLPGVTVAGDAASALAEARDAARGGGGRLYPRSPRGRLRASQPAAGHRRPPRGHRYASGCAPPSGREKCGGGWCPCQGFYSYIRFRTASRRALIPLPGPSPARAGEGMRGGARRCLPSPVRRAGEVPEGRVRAARRSRAEDAHAAGGSAPLRGAALIPLPGPSPASGRRDAWRRRAEKYRRARARRTPPAGCAGHLPYERGGGRRGGGGG